MPELNTHRITINKDTTVDINHVGRDHVGRVRLRDYIGDDPELKGTMEYYLPAGAVLHVPDYVGSGVADHTPHRPESPQLFKPPRPARHWSGNLPASETPAADSAPQEQEKPSGADTPPPA